MEDVTLLNMHLCSHSQKWRRRVTRSMQSVSWVSWSDRVKCCLQCLWHRCDGHCSQ